MVTEHKLESHAKMIGSLLRSFGNIGYTEGLWCRFRNVYDSHCMGCEDSLICLERFKPIDSKRITEKEFRKAGFNPPGGRDWVLLYDYMPWGKSTKLNSHLLHARAETPK